MPILRGIQCAYCQELLQSEYQMQIHLKTHKDEISKDRKLVKEETRRIRYNKEWF